MWIQVENIQHQVGVYMLIAAQYKSAVSQHWYIHQWQTMVPQVRTVPSK